MLNVLSATASAAGAIAAFLAFDTIPRLLPYFLALAADWASRHLPGHRAPVTAALARVLDLPSRASADQMS